MTYIGTCTMPQPYPDTIPSIHVGGKNPFPGFPSSFPGSQPIFSCYIYGAIITAEWSLGLGVKYVQLWAKYIYIATFWSWLQYGCVWAVHTGGSWASSIHLRVIIIIRFLVFVCFCHQREAEQVARTNKVL